MCNFTLLGFHNCGVEGEDEAEVQVDEQGLVEAQVQGEDEAGVVGNPIHPKPNQKV